MIGKRDRTNELKVFLNGNDQYMLNEKVTDYEKRECLRTRCKIKSANSKPKLENTVILQPRLRLISHNSGNGL